MTEFPTCMHRGEPIRPGWHRCGHPQLRVDRGVDLRTCSECHAAGVFCNRPPRDMTTDIMRNKKPHLLSRVWSLARSMRAFANDGLTTVDETQYLRRLEICDACDQRWNDDCKICGCRLSLKARGRAFSCPLGYWLAVASPDGADPDGDGGDRQ